MSDVQREDVTATEREQHYVRVVVVNPQLGMNSRFYADCLCGWHSPMYRTMGRAWEDGKAHRKSEEPMDLPPSKEHDGCNYLAVLIEHEDGPWYFCNKCGFGEDATDG